ncbi:sensor histidine kinase [Mycolicibacterium sediminis]|uniref:Putative sensor histidine kinase NarS n=1 Tax=Mycolicibacterium sediminis TaxID=1286180 RepID=A0A7I7QWT2_9MYCO|nr:ATP-binding protein [Mycolicibacterium sediminis]BBY30356.1 putative sensor histidine kinase NarS [Mycolicibacterium sediminis]
MIDVGADGAAGAEGRTATPHGSLLQGSLRLLLVAFIVITLLLEPPHNDRGACVGLTAAYVVVVGCWSVWAHRPRMTDSRSRTVNRVTLGMLAVDIAVVAVLSVLTGYFSQEDWTSDVLRNGLFLVPLIAAAQLSPYVSTVVAAPTVLAFVAASWITQSANEEPWASILLSTAILTGLAGGSVALSRIQLTKVQLIGQLAQQRTQLLHELLAVEKHERQEVAERVHDGALQYVLVARQDMEDVRGGDVASMSRVESALVEASRLLRDVARELHPEVLERLGLKAALVHLAAGLNERPDLDVEVDVEDWPDSGRSDVDYVLFGAAREMLTNAVKHARARTIWITLRNSAKTAVLTIADDGVGISEDAITKSQDDGHIGLSSIRTRVLASGGVFDVEAGQPGTRITIRIPLR